MPKDDEKPEADVEAPPSDPAPVPESENPEKVEIKEGEPPNPENPEKGKPIPNPKPLIPSRRPRKSQTPSRTRCRHRNPKHNGKIRPDLHPKKALPIQQRAGRHTSRRRSKRQTPRPFFQLHRHNKRPFNRYKKPSKCSQR